MLSCAVLTPSQTQTRTHTLPLPYIRTVTVPLLYRYCTVTVLLLYCYCAVTVTLLYCTVIYPSTCLYRTSLCQLEDARTVGDYGISGESTVHLVPSRPPRDSGPVDSAKSEEQ